MESTVSAATTIWNLTHKLSALQQKNNGSRKLWGTFIQRQIFWQEEQHSKNIDWS